MACNLHKRKIQGQEYLLESDEALAHRQQQADLACPSKACGVWCPVCHFEVLNEADMHKEDDKNVFYHKECWDRTSRKERKRTKCQK